MRSHAASDRRMPPVLHVPFAKLAGGGAQQVLAEQLRLGMHQGHRVLQLVAEAECAARLIKSGAGPHAAGQRLIDEPAVGQKIDRRVGRFDIDHAQRPAPVVPHALDRPMGAVDAAEALREALGFRRPARGADREGDGPLLSVFERQRRLNGGAGIVAGADAARESHAPHGRGIGQVAIAAEKLRAVAGEVRFVSLQLKNATRSPNSGL